jgi:hypothetical protein
MRKMMPELSPSVTRVALSLAEMVSSHCEPK